MSVSGCCKKWSGALTKGAATAYTTGEQSLGVVSRSGIIGSHEERVQAERCHLKHFTSIVDLVAQHFRVLQLFLPVGPSRIRISPEGVLPS